MDRKNNNDNSDDEDFETEEWTGDEDYDVEYNTTVNPEQEYLEEDEAGFDVSDYTEETTEKYGARNNDELADIQ